MSSLFPEDAFRNEKADEPWKKKETDKMLDLYFAGAHPKRIAHVLQRNPKAVKRRLEQFFYNERDRATKYEPVKRASRKGQRFTQSERKILKIWEERGLPLKVLAKVLMRDVEEVDPEPAHTSRVVHRELRDIAISTDILLAYRYLYYVKNVSIIGDKEYDELEKDEIEYGGGTGWLDKPASDRAEDYPEHVRALAMYLLFKYGKRI